jgi:hypothetical protein
LQRNSLNFIYLKLHAHEVCAVAVHGIDRDEAVAIRRHYVTILLELKRRDVCSGRLKLAMLSEYYDMCSDKYDDGDYKEK